MFAPNTFPPLRARRRYYLVEVVCLPTRTHRHITPGPWIQTRNTTTPDTDVANLIALGDFDGHHDFVVDVRFSHEAA